MKVYITKSLKDNLVTCLSFKSENVFDDDCNKFYDIKVIKPKLQDIIERAKYQIRLLEEQIEEAEQSLKTAEEFQEICDKHYKQKEEKRIIEEAKSYEIRELKPKVEYKVGDIYPDLEKLIPFEEGKTIEELGIDTKSKFVVVGENSLFRKGKILEFVRR